MLRLGKRGNQYLTVSGLFGLFLVTRCTGVNHWVNCSINQVRSPRIWRRGSQLSVSLSLPSPSLSVLPSSWQVDNYPSKREEIEVTVVQWSQISLGGCQAEFQSWKAFSPHPRVSSASCLVLTGRVVIWQLPSPLQSGESLRSRANELTKGCTWYKPAFWPLWFRICQKS